MLNTTIEKYFYSLTNLHSFNFQKEVANKLLLKQNVLLQTPTGAGKTWAAILPFIIAKCNNLDFPQKMIYSLPMRVLANSLFDIVSENDFIKDVGIKVSLQTGEQPNDPYFLDGDIIFTTIDQSLSSILSIPLNLSKRQANINAGALIGSYLVFDEFHLLDPNRSLSTLFHLLKILNGYSPFCLMTATLSERLLKELSREINANIVSVPENEIPLIPSQRNKKRIIEIKKNYLTIDQIIEHHKKGFRSIVICNNVEKCQIIFNELKLKKDEGASTIRDTILLCIHSRFFGKDRLRIEREIKKIFAKGSNADAILVSTQVIEVGIDITCNVMHTECSPINSLLQRIGRCARFENENGHVFVYEVENTYPYVDSSAEILKDTFKKLQEINGKNLDYKTSQTLIDHILSEKEVNELKGIQVSERNEDIKRSWMSCEKSEAHNLIRDINSIPVILLPDVNNISNPYHYEMLSIPRYTILNKLNKIEVDDWLIKTVRESNFIDEADYDNESMDQIIYSYDTASPECLKYESLVILNSNYVKYDDEIGLNFIKGNLFSGITNENTKLKKNFNITKDTYEEHIDYVIKAYKRYFKKNHFLHKEFCRKLEIDLPFDELIIFMAILHDYGKLDLVWQKKALELQRERGTLNNSIYLAHTDFRKGDERSKFPPHAGAGAIVSIAILEAYLSKKGYKQDLIIKICKVVASSILRHHSPLSIRSNKYRTVREAVHITKKLFSIYQINDLWVNNVSDLMIGYDDFQLTDYIISFSTEEDKLLETLLYFYLVRILRICDQKSFEIKQEEINV